MVPTIAEIKEAIKPISSRSPVDSFVSVDDLLRCSKFKEGRLGESHAMRRSSSQPLHNQDQLMRDTSVRAGKGALTSNYSNNNFYTVANE